jgi:hypothetical protein
MARRGPEQRRFLGLWTAAWLFALLLAGVLRVGDLRVQWPVLLIPVLWALVALRPRRPRRRRRDVVPDDPSDDASLDDGDDPELRWYDRPAAEPRDRGAVFPERRDPGTREQPWLPEVPPAPPRQE